MFETYVWTGQCFTRAIPIS